MTENQSKQVSILLHTISDFERLGDHAVNLSRSANELHEKKIGFSDEAVYELGVLWSAVRDILDLTVRSFSDEDVHIALQVEPLRELINVLCNELKSRHITRLKNGKCEMKQGFAFNNILTDFERIGAHCSNVTLAILEVEAEDLDMHEYQKSIREMNNELYTSLYENYENKYNINKYKKWRKSK